MKDLFESLAQSVSEECFEDIMKIMETFINEFIKKDKMQQLENTTAARIDRAEKTPEGPEKDEAVKKANRNVVLTYKKVMRDGSSKQKSLYNFLHGGRRFLDAGGSHFYDPDEK